MPLTDRQIVALKPADRTKKVSDGGGLHLVIPPNGSKLWRLAYRFDGKQKLLSLGSYPIISLADARERRTQAKKLLALGADPSTQKKLDKIARQTASANTFASIANELIEKNEKEGRAKITVDKKRWLLEQIRQDLGARPISELTASEILLPLKRVEAAGNYETAKRMRSFISEVCRFGISTARLSTDPTYGLKGALIAPKTVHMAAITTWPDFVRLINGIWNYSGRPETKHALMLMALLYPRPVELRIAEWQEIDFENRIWTIPAKHAKMRRPHTKPLSKLALAVLTEQRKFSGNRRLIFPGMGNAERPISENTLNLALRRMGFSAKEATSHGFRATASTLLNEDGKWQEDAIEAELAHQGTDEVRRAYHRARYWDERVKMADWWSQEISNRVGDNG